MKAKIVHHIAYDIWNKLQSVTGELKQIEQYTLDGKSQLCLRVAKENLTDARKLVALLTEADYDVDAGD